MPTQALALALAASIYPPAVAAVIALGRGAQVRSRVFVFVLAAAATTYATGALMLLLLDELGASGGTSYTPSAAVDLALGLLLIGLAARLYRRRTDPNTHSSEHPDTALGERPDSAAPEAAPGTPSKIQRYLESRRLAFVLGVTLYVLPSPIYIGAVKAIADAKLSTSGELAALAATVAVMLWMIELPMLMLLALPVRASRALEQINLWFSRNGRAVAILASAGAGVYLAAKGLVDLLG